MGSHRKPRVGFLSGFTTRRGAVGVGVLALASATLFGSTARADDDASSVEEQRDRADEAHERAVEVRDRVDELYREAGTATQHYNAAQEATDRQQEIADELMEEAAAASEQVNEARQVLGTFATAQYRLGGGLSDTAALLLAPDVRSFFDTRNTLNRLTEAQRQAVTDFTERSEDAEAQRADASEALAELEASEAERAEQEETVQGKLTEARELLDQLTDEEEAELAELERLEREEAERLAEEARRAQEEREAAERAAAEQAADGGTGGEAADIGGGEVSGQAEAAIAFAETQLGKPYVWGATGPNSYDCSGLTQAAWRAAGVSIPRVTWDQVNIGTPVSRDALRPGDLVFFYADISHVGLYIGDGLMIHAPKPGDVVKVESIDYMPFHSAVRPA
ncbi:C40 family peptidase [Streptomyces sp. NBC_01803]|uniref:C40 family peptidase n=1 Tax=Streptomyces sp. NBC_01803 TaxID=2975946 RepID=UPI002DD924E9|nr:NlpC/P60 family protein [Streptomyces sp. NBC_01803]WSA45853.1 NlpC/P60 family protein [Streptomyces sp. NBC_01803]